jgi:RNA polymerase-binding transcription factor DksA
MRTTLQKAEAILLRKRRSLLRTLGSYRDDGSPDCTAELSAHDLGQLRETHQALARIADGTYGLCEQCGGRIADDLLRSEPAATLCRAHQRQAA